MSLQEPVYNRRVLRQVLIEHQTITGPPPYAFSCLCGFGREPRHLGLAHADHLLDVYELAVEEPGCAACTHPEIEHRPDYRGCERDGCLCPRYQPPGGPQRG